MSEVFVGQIMMSGFGFAPRGFAACDGQLLRISQNQALFALIGTTYGGDGVSVFNVPDLQGRTPVGSGQPAQGGRQTYPAGMAGGAEQVTLTPDQMPAHGHQMRGMPERGTAGPPTRTSYYATAAVTDTETENIYAAPDSGPLVPLLGSTVGNAGSSMPHPNMQPFAVINFSIALSGIFPSRP